MTDNQTELRAKFYAQLMQLIMLYIDRGLSPGQIEDAAYQAVEDMFGTEEYVDGE